MMDAGLRIGWTTVGSQGAAEQLAQGLVESDLAACVQVEGGVTSHYKWKGELCREPEWRLMVKFAASKREVVEAFIMREHPYETPEWVVLRPDSVAPAYLRWALGD
jgi:periplasmic divalent cation tolerance protein